MASNKLFRDARSIMNPYASFLSPGPLGRDMAIQLSTGLFTGIPVVDQDQTILGIVTQENIDWVRKRGEDLPDVLAEQVMTVLPAYLHEDMTIEEVGEHLIRAHVMQLPVVRYGKLIGVITRWMVFGQNSLVPDLMSRNMLPTSAQEFPSYQQPLPDPSSPVSWSPDHAKVILVVDDDPVISGLLGDMLGDMGYRVRSAANGKEALWMIHEHAVDGILLDLEMPIMDGATALDELRWQNVRTPVVVMSGGMDRFTLQDFMHEGAQGYLEKPFTLESLHAHCERCFGPPAKSVRATSESDDQSFSPQVRGQYVPVGS